MEALSRMDDEDSIMKCGVESCGDESFGNESWKDESCGDKSRGDESYGVEPLKALSRLNVVAELSRRIL